MAQSDSRFPTVCTLRLSACLTLLTAYIINLHQTLIPFFPFFFTLSLSRCFHFGTWNRSEQPTSAPTYRYGNSNNNSNKYSTTYLTPHIPAARGGGGGGGGVGGYSSQLARSKSPHAKYRSHMSSSSAAAAGAGTGTSTWCHTHANHLDVTRAAFYTCGFKLRFCSSLEQFRMQSLYFWFSKICSIYK